MLAFRVDAPLMTVYNFHDEQLRAQGFNRASQNMAGNAAQATYTRGNSQVKVNLTRQGNGSYRATFDLSGVQMMAGGNGAATATTTDNRAVTPLLPVTVVGITKFTPEQNAAAGRNALVSAKDFGGVQYQIYGPIELNDLTNNASVVRFTIPQGSTLTETDINVNGDLMGRIAGTTLDLQQVMDFYDRQFKAQGFKLVNPTDTGAGLDYAPTYIYERGAQSRVSFSVEKKFDTYCLVWDFQQS